MIGTEFSASSCRPRLRQLVLIGLITVSGCNSGVDATSQAIINGTAATVGQHPWAVAVANVSRTGSTGLCTGTLISDYAVLTAKHCVFQDVGGGQWRAVPPADLRVLVAHDINRADGVIDIAPVIEVRTSPGGWNDTNIGDGTDIAVVLIGRRLAGEIEPQPTATAAPGSGASALIVGFGVNNTTTDESGVKYWGMTTVEAVGSVELRAGGASWTCQGDSGGPLIVDGEVAAVTSWGLGGCGPFSQHFFTLVSVHQGLIQGAIAFEPPCEPTAEGCDGEDNDCDDRVDEGCTGLGEACVADNECSNGRCGDTTGGRLCTRDCDPRANIPMCPFGFHCEAVGCGQGQCIAGEPGSLPDGELCNGNLDCAGARCALVGDAMRCSRQCDPAQSSCNESVCELDGSGCGACTPYEFSTRPRPFGLPCQGEAMCMTSLCLIEGGTEGFCTQRCSADVLCPNGFHCREGLCRAGELAAPGGACINSEDCGLGSQCVGIDGDQVCALPCGEGCEAGFECADAQLGGGMSAPMCVAEGIGLGQPCGQNEECRTGICAGTCTRICDETPCPADFECRPAGPVSGCFPPRPQEEEGCSAAGAMPAWVPLTFLFVLFANRFRRQH